MNLHILGIEEKYTVRSFLKNPEHSDIGFISDQEKCRNTGYYEVKNGSAEMFEAVYLNFIEGRNLYLLI